jgi:hypothetical protein
VIFFGPAAPSVIANVNGEGGQAAFSRAGEPPRLVVANGCPLCAKGASSCGSVAKEIEEGFTCVRGHYADPATLSSIRALIGAENDVALVLSGAVDEAEVEAILSGLSPFLGKKGVVLFAAGRYESDELEAATAIGRPIQSWVRANAAKLGLGFHQTTTNDQSAARDWIILWHSPEAMDWSRQWMPMVADLGFDGDAPAEGRETPSDGAAKEIETAAGNTAESVVPAGAMTSELR